GVRRPGHRLRAGRRRTRAGVGHRRRSAPGPQRRDDRRQRRSPGRRDRRRRRPGQGGVMTESRGSGAQRSTGQRSGARTSGALRTIRRGLALSPELRTGLARTLGLAMVAMVGRVAVPIAVQQVIDRGLRAPGGPDSGVVLGTVTVALAVLAVTTLAQSLMMRRLFTATETALATVRTRTFRHIHDLSMLHQQGERRGALT